MSSVGEVSSGCRPGIYSGACHFFLVESSHRELVVAGPAATATIRLEDEADAGEVLVSPATAAAVGPEWLAGERGGAALLALDREPDAAAPPVVETPTGRPSALELEPFVPVALRSYLRLEAGEAEHRQVTAAFVKFTGVEALLAQRGPAAVGEPLDALGAVVGRVTSELGLTWLESDIDVDGGKLYLAAGAPSTHRGRRGADAARAARDPRRGLRPDAPRGRQPRPGVRRRHRREHSPHLRRHGRHRQSRRAAGRAGRAGRDPRHRRGARALADPLRDRTAAVPRQGQGASDHGLQRRRRHRCRGGGTSSGAADRRSRAGAGGARGGRRCGAPAPGPGGRARRGAGDRQIAPRRGAEDHGARLHAARRALRPVRDVRPLLAVSLAAPPARRNHRGGEPPPRPAVA